MSSVSSAVSTPALRERFGWHAERRPEPGFAHVLGAGAGVFVWLATFMVIAEVTSDNPRLPGILFNLALLVIGVIVGARMSGPVRTGAVTLCVLSVPGIWGFTLFSNGGGGHSDWDTRGFYLLTILSYLVLFTLLWTKGRGILLGLVLLLLFSWIVWEIDNGNGTVPFQTQINQQTQSHDGNFSFDRSADNDGSNTTATSTAALVIGLVYLAAAAALDRKKLAGLATPFVVVGLIATVLGATVLGFRESVIAGGLSLAAAGVVVGVVGGWGRDRRFSTWFGVVLIVVGLTAVVIDVQDSKMGAAGLFLLMALGLGGLAWFAAPRLHEFVDGDIESGTTSGQLPPP